MIEWDLCETPIGDCVIAAKDGVITHLTFERLDWKKFPEDSRVDLTELVEKVFAGEKPCFEINGTDFQKRVYRELIKIDSRITYGELAVRLGDKNLARALGRALGENKVGILIPCHLVVGKKDLGGFRWGIERKKWLLENHAFQKN